MNRKKNSSFYTYILAGLVLSYGFAPSGQAFTIAGLEKGGPGETTKLSPDKKFQVSLTTIPVKHLDDPTKDDLSLLKKEYPKWTFEDGKAAPGTLNILQYDSFALNTRGGANFTTLYDDGNAKARTDYSWIQIGRPDDWGSFGSKVHIDSKFSNFPFYADYTPLSLPTGKTPTVFFAEGGAIWLDSKNYPQQNIQNPTGGGKVPAGDLLFVDEPFCTYTCTEKDGKSSHTFDLFLVSFTWNGKDKGEAAGTVTIHDGVRWGVKVEKAVPEPLTILGAGTAVGFGAFFKRKLAQKQGKEKANKC